MSQFILSAFADEISSDFRTQMDVLDQHGISYIEMRGVNGRNITEYTLEEAKLIKQQMDSRGFKLSSVGSPVGKISILDDFEPHLKLFKHTLDLAKLFESNYIRMFSFFIPKGEAPKKYRDEVLKRWSSFLQEAKGSGVTLLHENEKDIYGDTALRCLDLMQSLNCDNVKTVFDPANFVQCDELTYPYAYELLEEYIAYVHIKDALSADHQVVPAGHGDGHVKEILTALKKRGYEGFLSLEPHLGQFTGFAKLELNSVSEESADNGPALFAIAADALKNILKGI
ncbi:MAG: xylose isomerase [Herbinix sp.]|nr:xylose isomerase [Herbinix sp.]